MAHKVEINVPVLEMGKADAIFTIKQDGATLGALHISRGAIVWFPANCNYGHKLSWKRFADLMVEHGIKPSEVR
jgi:hypothetical protein